MSKANRLKKTDDNTEINISPMIDMVFILLIFFIVTTVFVDEKGLAADKPQPSAQPTDPTDDEPVVFKVLANGQIEFEGNRIPLTRIELITKTRLSQADVPVIIQVDRSAIAGMMIQVMDRAKLGGADKISVTQLN